MAYLINPSNKSYTYVDGENKNDISVCTVMMESEDDLSALGEDIAVGSLAYTAGFGHVYQKDFDGNWVEVILQ